MKSVPLKAFPRTQVRRGEVKKLRSSGRVPAIIYGRQAKPQNLELSAKEFALLEYLVRNQGAIVTRTMISEHVWDINFDTATNVIDVYINYLRRKIDQGRPKKLIHTVRGRGYTLKI